jgi:predicted HAD superfamily hydrolase
MDKKIYSFDIFDTVIVRNFARPKDLFWELGRRIQKANLTSMPPEEWMKVRIESELEARNISSHGEVNIQEIYECLVTKINWSSEVMLQAIEREIELELEVLRPVPEVKQQIDRLRQEDREIIYLSDMYLPKEVIEKLLRKNKIWNDRDRLYVSNDLRLNKASGKLFTYCLERESIDPKQLYHQGDNISADVIIPQKLGINTQHFVTTRLNRYEESISQSDLLPLKFRSLLAGASRIARLQAPEKLERQEKIIWQTTTAVVAPVLFGFVCWCLTEARKMGIKRLYFVARDGQILLKIAKIVQQKWNYDDIDCRYLYGSRQAWHFPAIEKIGKVELDWICDPTHFLSIESVCQRVNLKPEIIEDILQKYELPKEVWHNNLDLKQRERLQNIFQEPKVCESIVSLAREYRQKSIGYFQQEGLCEDIPWAMIDIGWNGRLQQSLTKLLKSAAIYPERGVTGFYFGLAKKLKADERDSLFAYFYDAQINTDKDNLCRYRELFELLVAADHGGTKEFDLNTEGKYTPILRSSTNDRALAWGLTIQQKATETFAEILTELLEPSEVIDRNFIAASEILLASFINNPTVEEANIYGSFSFAEDQNETKFYQLAPKYQLIDALRLLFFRKNIHQCVWLPASIANSNYLSKNILRLNRQMGQIKHKLLDLLSPSK